MPLRLVDWEANKDLPVDRGATVRQFLATVGKDKLEINVAPWGEGQLKINGIEVARTAEAKDRRQAFTHLKQAAERHMRGEPIDMPLNGKLRVLPAVKAKLLEGKKGLVVGIANERSIAWGCAAAFRAFGADLAVTYLNEKARKHVDPLARTLESSIVMPLDVRVPGQMESGVRPHRKRMGKAGLRCALDSVRAAGCSARTRRRCASGRLSDHHAGLMLDIPSNGQTCRALDEKGRHSLYDDILWQPDGGEELQHHGGGEGSPGECGEYVSAELGPKGIRVHAISPGPLATRAASGIPEFDKLLEKAKAKALARSLVSIEDVGAATAFLAHDAARLITGDTIYIDGGYHVVD